MIKSNTQNSKIISTIVLTPTTFENMSNRQELIQSIGKYLARFSEQVEVLNSIGDFSINKYAEDILVELLNNVFDTKFENLNHSTSGNYPAIDLLAKDKGISIQVTSTNNLEKIKKTLSKFFDHEHFKEVKELYIYILKQRNEKYNQKLIESFIDEKVHDLIAGKVISSRSEIKFQFDTSNNIIDKVFVLNTIENKFKTVEKLKEIETYLKREFGKIDEKDNLSKYNQELKQLYHETVLDDERGMTLSDIYVEPSFKIYKNAFDKSDDRFVDVKKSEFYGIDKRYDIHEFILDSLNNENPLSICVDRSIFLILGYPGQGKSSFCKRLIHDILSKKVNNQKSVFHFQLKNVRQVREFIFSPLKILHEEACLKTGQDLNKSEFRNSILILDGLDELFMRDDLKLEDIDKLCIELVRECQKYADLRIILTSRYGYINIKYFLKEPIIVLELSPLNIQLQKRWLEKYIQFHPETWLTAEKIEVIGPFSRLGYLNELMSQPILLHMIASLKEDINTHTNRSQVYSRLFTELIDRKYSKDGQLEILRNIDKDDLRTLIQEIAFSIFESGEGYITKNKLLQNEHVQSFLSKIPNKHFKESIKGIMISFYFKESQAPTNDEADSKENYAIEFLHGSLKEYMVAEKIYFTLKNEFTDTNSKKKYIVDTGDKALEILNRVFSKQYLTTEIRQYLKQIITTDTDSLKGLLLDRLCYFAPDFFHKDFLYQFDSRNGTLPLENIKKCFIGYWSILSFIGLKQDILESNGVSQRFAHLLNVVSSTKKSRIMPTMDLSHQNLGANVFYGVSFDSCKFENTILKSCFFNDCSFSNIRFSLTVNQCRFNQSQFTYCTFENSKFNNVTLDSVLFYNCPINSLELSDTEIHNLKIEDYYGPESQSYKEKQISFINVTLDQESLEVIKQCSNINEGDYNLIEEFPEGYYEDVTPYDYDEDDFLEIDQQAEPEDYKRIDLTDLSKDDDLPF